MYCNRKKIPKVIEVSKRWAEDLLTEEMSIEFGDTDELADDLPEEKFLLGRPVADGFLLRELVDDDLDCDEYDEETVDDAREGGDFDEGMVDGFLDDDAYNESVVDDGRKNEAVGRQWMIEPRGSDEADDALAELELKVHLAYNAKWEAYEEYTVKRDQASDAYNVMEELWQEKMRMVGGRVSREEYVKLWKGFNEMQEDYNARIRRLRVKIRRKHRKARRAMERSKKLHQNGRHDIGMISAERCYKYLDVCNEMNQEVMGMIDFLRTEYEKIEKIVFGEEAREPVKMHEYNVVKAKYIEAEMAFFERRKERNALYKIYNMKNNAYVKLRKELLRRRKRQEDMEVMREKRLHEVSLMEQFEIPLKYWYNCKVAKKEGQINFYFGGKDGIGDGIEHGHVVVDTQRDKIIYRRMPGVEHGIHNFVWN